MTAMPVLSPRVRAIQPSPASVLRRRARELRGAGRDIIELSSGNLDFATPDHVIAAAHQAALRGDTRYTDVDGTPELKQAVRAALRRDHGLDYATDEIVITNGSTQALFNALLATLAQGDEVIVPAPIGRLTSTKCGSSAANPSSCPVRRTTASSCGRRIWRPRSPRKPAG
jgi:aspartate aminotransferase